MSKETDVKINIFYNGGCPICRTEIEHYLRLDRRNGQQLGFIDIAGAEHVCPFDRTEMLKRLHVVDADGNKFVGVDAFIEIWRHLPYYRHLASFTRIPLIRGLAIRLYDGVLAPWLFRMHEKRVARQNSDRKKYFAPNET